MHTVSRQFEWDIAVTTVCVTSAGWDIAVHTVSRQLGWDIAVHNVCVTSAGWDIAVHTLRLSSVWEGHSCAHFASLTNLGGT